MRQGRKASIKSFQCPVRDTYAASEFMGIAFDCRYGRLHVNADWLILESVDAAGDPVAPGEASHTTLLTNLANRIQPRSDTAGGKMRQFFVEPGG